MHPKNYEDYKNEIAFPACECDYDYSSFIKRNALKGDKLIKFRKLAFFFQNQEQFREEMFKEFNRLQRECKSKNMTDKNCGRTEACQQRLKCLFINKAAVIGTNFDIDDKTFEIFCRYVFGQARMSRNNEAELQSHQENISDMTEKINIPNMTVNKSNIDLSDPVIQGYIKETLRRGESVSFLDNEQWHTYCLNNGFTHKSSLTPK